MILNDKEAIKRLDSPINLVNRLRREVKSTNSAMSLFGLRPENKQELVRHSFNPFDTKTVDVPKPLLTIDADEAETESSVLDNIVENNDSQIRLGLAHDNALNLLNRSIEMLAVKLDDIKADKLPSVIAASSKTVESIRRERLEASRGENDKNVHYHFYTPPQKVLTDYEIIEVSS